MQPRKHLLATCSVLLIAALLAACAAPAAAPAPPVDTPEPPADTPEPPAAESDPVAVVQAWADAMYRGDVDAALDLFTDDGSYMIGGTASRPQEMRWLFDWYASLETKWEILDCQPKDASIACDLAVLDGCIAASGSKGLPMKATFTLQDGKIKEAVGSGTGPEWNAYWDFTSTSGSWMRVFRPEEYARFQEGTVEGGKLIIKLCREYKNAVKTQGPATAAAAQSLVNAINSGNADAALALLTDDAKFGMLNDKAAGVEELRSMFDWLASRETQFQISDCEWKGISTQCAMTVVDGCVTAFGAPDGLPGKMTFSSLEDGTLRNVSGVLAGAERKSYDEWIEAESAWASTNRAEEFAQAEGYSQAAGAMAVKLCQEYAAAVLTATPLPARSEAAGAQPAPATAEPLPVIWDDDGSIDGVTALLYLLQNRSFEVKAATISPGSPIPVSLPPIWHGSSPCWEWRTFPLLPARNSRWRVTTRFPMTGAWPATSSGTWSFPMPLKPSTKERPHSS